MELENKNPPIKRYQLGENYNQNSCQNCQNLKKQYDTKVDQLTESVNQLKVTIEELADTTVQQNTVIMEALATQKVLTEKLLGKEKNEVNVRKIFPIQTVDDLAATNNKIKEGNRAVYIRCMSSLLKGQLHKSLTEIFSVIIIFNNMYLMNYKTGIYYK